MGLLRTGINTVSGVLSDQWKEYFYCDSLPADVLAIRGRKRVSGGSNNGLDNIISNGSVIAVADGQCMMIVEQGKIVDLCAEPGEYVYDISTEPSLFDGGKLASNIKQVFQSIGKRFTFGGVAPKEQRVYYFNTKELVGNKYGTPSPVPFRVVDAAAGIDMDISIRCFGEYSYRITNPLLFYTNLCGNVENTFTRDRIDGQLKTELLTALQPTFAKISDMGIRYSSLPGHTMEIAQTLNDVLSPKWRDLRGIEVVSFGVSSVKASEEDERTIKEMQQAKAYANPGMAAANLARAQANAMQDAARNSGGAAVGFMGMNMAQTSGGFNAQSLYQMGAQQSAAPAADGWTCPQCGKVSTGNFCSSCGAKKPEPAAANGWTCPTCGALNKDNFCSTCGAKKPAGQTLYKCNKCGWEPEDPANPPRFCPRCGDPFNDGDIKA